VWDRFSQRARNAIEAATEAARERGTRHVTAGHLLLGLLREENSVAARLLGDLGVTSAAARAAAEPVAGRDDGPPLPGPDEGQMRLAPSGERAIDLALAEVRSLGEKYVGTEHLLLGVLGCDADPPSRALASALAALGADRARARQALAKLCDL
jgi:ATP-dependent Clp protease ATP-binding subunit ClpC